ncbi:hypothetical protein KL911_003206 [Ogataea haglerorum]|uniref:uncharacterized protein n=1 Tax=Ogataea haglerorum TaxID=1937702 RepID=UPI001C892603|nr:uncharacterized protein KL911_003206 [Ogataea haglerorum]KAG7753101.1 hypothetical protein KL911_003206 [Ogataea haglerorum]
MSAVDPLPSREYWDGLINVKTSNWKYTLEELQQGTPSRKKGSELKKVSFEDECQKRAKGIIYLFKCCRQLRLSRSVAMTASCYFHRFYMRRDMLSHHYFEVAATSLFIACKAEECRRRLADVVKVCAKTAMANSQDPIDENSKIFWRWKDLMINLEEMLLETLCFEVTPSNPYKLCLSALKLEEDMPRETDWLKRSKDLFIQCTNVYELTSRVPLVLLHEPNVIAMLGVVLSCAKDQSTKFPPEFVQELGTDQEQVWACYQDLVALSRPLNSLEPPFQVLQYLPKLEYEQFTGLFGAVAPDSAPEKNQETLAQDKKEG